MAFRASLSAGLLVGLMIMQHDSSATPKIPPGFEALAQGQLVWVDVSLYGKSLGLYEANINLEQVVFIKPAELADAVKQQFNDDPELGAQLMTALGNRSHVMATLPAAVMVTRQVATIWKPRRLASSMTRITPGLTCSLTVSTSRKKLPVAVSIRRQQKVKMR